MLCFGTRRKTIPGYPEKQGLVEGSGTDLVLSLEEKRSTTDVDLPWATPVTVAGHAYRCVLSVYTKWCC